MGGGERTLGGASWLHWSRLVAARPGLYCELSPLSVASAARSQLHVEDSGGVFRCACHSERVTVGNSSVTKCVCDVGRHDVALSESGGKETAGDRRVRLK